MLTSRLTFRVYDLSIVSAKVFTVYIIKVQLVKKSPQGSAGPEYRGDVIVHI